jgi:uncharacterized membrane protein
VTLYEWLLFFHVLAAFALVAGVVAFGTVVLGDRGRVVRRVLATPSVALWNVGGIGVLVFGIWLALHVSSYDLLDGWILAAIVLWVIAYAASGPLSRGLRDDAAALDRARAQLLYAVMTIATAALLVDMIFKPGA